MGVRRWLAAFAAGLSLWVAVPALADPLGQLRVTVVEDMDELPVSDVTVRLSREASIAGEQKRKKKKKASSDPNGTALFPDLPPGIYRLEAVRAGFRDVHMEGIEVRIDRTTELTVRIRAGEL